MADMIPLPMRTTSDDEDILKWREGGGRIVFNHVYGRSEWYDKETEKARATDYALRADALE